jgi:hypothetical protein
MIKNSYGEQFRPSFRPTDVKRAYYVSSDDCALGNAGRATKVMFYAGVKARERQFTGSADRRRNSRHPSDTRKGIYAMIERAQIPGVTRIGRRVLVRSDVFTTLA